MLSKSLLRELEKIGLIPEVRDDFVKGISFYVCKGTKYECSWQMFHGYDDIDLLHVKLLGEKRDIYSDDFPGFFPKTIKLLIKFMKET